MLITNLIVLCVVWSVIATTARAESNIDSQPPPRFNLRSLTPYSAPITCQKYKRLHKKQTTYFTSSMVYNGHEYKKNFRESHNQLENFCNEDCAVDEEEKEYCFQLLNELKSESQNIENREENLTATFSMDKKNTRPKRKSYEKQSMLVYIKYLEDMLAKKQVQQMKAFGELNGNNKVTNKLLIKQKLRNKITILRHEIHTSLRLWLHELESIVNRKLSTEEKLKIETANEVIIIGDESIDTIHIVEGYVEITFQLPALTEERFDTQLCIINPSTSSRIIDNEHSLFTVGVSMNDNLQRIDKVTNYRGYYAFDNIWPITECEEEILSNKSVNTCPHFLEPEKEILQAQLDDKTTLIYIKNKRAAKVECIEENSRNKVRQLMFAPTVFMTHWCQKIKIKELKKPKVELQRNKRNAELEDSLPFPKVDDLPKVKPRSMLEENILKQLELAKQQHDREDVEFKKKLKEINKIKSMSLERKFIIASGILLSIIIFLWVGKQRYRRHIRNQDVRDWMREMSPQGTSTPIPNRPRRSWLIPEQSLLGMN